MNESNPVPDLYQARPEWEGGAGEWMNVTREQAEVLRGEKFRDHFRVRELAVISGRSPEENGVLDSLPNSLEIRAQQGDEDCLPNSLITLGVNADGRIIFDKVLSTVRPEEDYDRMVRAVELANQRLHATGALSPNLVEPPSDAEMNVALENMDVSTEDGVKAFVQWAFECANASAAG
jgi:hypothetical protein